MKGLLVIGHGSRATGTKDIFKDIVAGVRSEIGDSMVEGCFMNQTPETVDKLYSKGVRELVVLPCFLFPGVHMLKDIPEILRNSMEKHEGLKIAMSKPIGYHSKLIEILVERAEGEKNAI